MLTVSRNSCPSLLALAWGAERCCAVRDPSKIKIMHANAASHHNVHTGLFLPSAAPKNGMIRGLCVCVQRINHISLMMLGTWKGLKGEREIGRYTLDGKVRQPFPIKDWQWAVGREMNQWGAYTLMKKISSKNKEIIPTARPDRVHSKLEAEALEPCLHGACRWGTHLAFLGKTPLP